MLVTVVHFIVMDWLTLQPVDRFFYVSCTSSACLGAAL